MTKLLFFFTLISNAIPANLPCEKERDYNFYHQQVLEAEKHIASENYDRALKIYEGLFDNYDFVFMREYQIAV